MIIEFSVQNFRSIRNLQTISFQSTGLKSSEENKDVDLNNISIDGNERLLKTVGIYGSNASGKSNVIRALEYFLTAIRNEASSESNMANLCDPFLYQDEPQLSETLFQIVLIIEGKKYRYGFTIRKNQNTRTDQNVPYSKEVIVDEWLNGQKEKNNVEIFRREKSHVNKEKLTNSDIIPTIPYEHTLFLTHAAAFDPSNECAIIRKYIIGWTLSNFSKGLEPFRRNIFYLLEYENRKADLLKILETFNLKYDDIIIEKDPNNPDSIIIPRDKIFMIKSYKANENQLQEVRLNLKDNESDGTQKLFDLIGVLLRAFQMTQFSAFFIIDEIDSNFHPSLLIKLISLFNDPKINQSKSQLLFTSHDTNLMSPTIMRRDQFYFTEKGEDDSTRLYSLADLKGIRNDADFAKQYLAGLYGGIPILRTFNNIDPV
jgi:AAA15 family ATPase/GTPase